MVLSVAAVMAQRMGYPYDLEWMEGGQLTHAWRVSEGRPLYPEPGPEWIPYIYPPGHAWLMAAVGRVAGLSLPVGRALSWLGVGLTMTGMVWLFARHGTGRRWVGAVVAVATWFCCYSASGAFFDLVRPDALALGSLMVALALAVEKHPGLVVLGGVFLAMAFWFKHPMAAFGLPIVVGLWIRDGHLRSAGWFLVAAVGLGLGLTGLQAALEPEFLTYIVAVPASHDIIGYRVIPLTPWELASPISMVIVASSLVAWGVISEDWKSLTRWGGISAIGVVAAVMAWAGMGLVPPRITVSLLGAWSGTLGLLVGLGLLWRTARHGRGTTWPLFVGVGVVAVALAAWMRGHVGGFVNVYLPAFAMLALASGWASATVRGSFPTGLIGVALSAQFSFSPWSLPSERLVPSADQRAEGDRIVEALRTRPGPVWSPVAPWMAVQAGHEPGPHLIALWDVANHPDGPWPNTRRRFEEAAASGYWATVLQGRQSVDFGLRAHYHRTERLEVQRSFRPRTGWRNAPADIWGPASQGFGERDAPGHER